MACLSFIGCEMKAIEISIIKDEIKSVEDPELYMDTETTITIPDDVKIYVSNRLYFGYRHAA